MEYNIKSKPTVYNHTKYRSRLEARWAAFFDEIGWRYQYEPYNFKGWTPDFVIYGSDAREILIEIKPFIDDEIIREYRNRISPLELQNYIIILDNDFISKGGYGGIYAGCAINYAWESDLPNPFGPSNIPMHWKDLQKGINSEYDIGSQEMAFDGILWNDYDCRKVFVDEDNPDLLMRWERADRKTRFSYD